MRKAAPLCMCLKRWIDICRHGGQLCQVFKAEGQPPDISVLPAGMPAMRDPGCRTTAVTVQCFLPAQQKVLFYEQTAVYMLAYIFF